MNFDIHLPDPLNQFLIDYKGVRDAIRYNKIYTVIISKQRDFDNNFIVLQMFVQVGQAKSNDVAFLSKIFGVPESQLEDFNLLVSTMHDFDIVSIGFPVQCIDIIPEQIKTAILMNLDRVL